LLVLSNLVLLSFAQDSGDGFVFKCKQPGQVALTFDDGPSAENTPKLLKILEDNDIKSTFFVLTVNIEEGNNKNILKQTFDAGHEIALHSSTHANMNELPEAGVREEYTKNINAVKSVIGLTPNYARPPFGNCNAGCAKVMKELGLTVIQWNADSQDWQYAGAKNKQQLTVTNIVDIIAKSNPKKDSFITLQHDIQPFSVDLTPKIIESIKKAGYTFVTVSQCLKNKPPAYKEGAKTSVTSTILQPTSNTTQPLVATSSIAASSSPITTGYQSPPTSTSAKAKATPKTTGTANVNNNQNKTDNTATTSSSVTGTASSADKIVSSSILGIFSLVFIISLF